MIKKIFSTGLVVAIILLLNNPVKKNLILPNIPIAVGKLLNPFSGYAALINSDELPTKTITSNNLIDTVNIKWDNLRIPHIEAKNESDLYFIQGYIMAFDRLWQMEFQTHAAAGRISEIIGAEGLNHDRLQRRRGMVYAAQNTINEIEKNDSLYKILISFTNGINFYIDSLDDSQYPIEYKILNYKPEKWTPLKTSLLLKSMAWQLTNRHEDLEYTKILNDFGMEIIKELFPQFPLDYEPIHPRNTKFDFPPIKKDAPKEIYKSKNYKLNTTNNKKYSLGSNNWVLSGKRTKNKVPILANDPHLNLSLPSIWYLMHLKCPTINVMGVTIPGAPGIIIGFNDNIAWGVTNGYDDVMDWYEINFYDTKKKEYFYDNQWISTNQIVEKILIKDELAFYDTIIYTHHGPVVWDNDYRLESIYLEDKTGLALQWTGHDSTNELLSFYMINKAENYNQFKESLKTYDCPGQNFIYSDKKGDIAIFHSGKTPIRWDRQGMFIGDGSSTKYDWINYIPFEQRILVKNPIKGYLSSANQIPVDENYPYYLSEYFAPSYRATQINRRIESTYNGTIEDMINIQLDNTYLLAEKSLPILLKLIDNQHSDSIEVNYWINQLKQWDYKYNRESIAATFFEEWINSLQKNTWENYFGDKHKYIWPEVDKLEELIINAPNSSFFDNKHTEKIENLDYIANKSFNDVTTQLSMQLKRDTTQLKWKNYRGTNIKHLAQILAFSKLNLKTGGSENIINATRKTEGPSWRYIIEMSSPYNIKGIYPGGQSGYPGSIYYDNFIEDWISGNYYNLIFPNNKTEFIGSELQCLPIQ